MPSIKDFANQKLPPALEKKMMRDMFFAPGWRDWRRGFIEAVGQPPNLDPGGDYNYRGAYLSGAVPELDPVSGEFHGMSSAIVPPYKEPVDFKAEDHPTAWKEKFMRKFGKNPDLSKDWTAEERSFLEKELLAQEIRSAMGQK